VTLDTKWQPPARHIRHDVPAERYTAPPAQQLKVAHAVALKVEEGAVGEHRARHLIRWYEHGEGAARIGWGAPGDFARCVAIASEHMTEEQAKGFCNLRHHGALGIYPATHAAAERGHGV
jgi:hypothetical protein